MPFDWTSGALAEGLRCYRSEQFFEAHEHWEAVWLECSEPEKTLLQSLIQVSAAFHHLNHDNRVGAISLLTRALCRLEGFPEEYNGISLLRLREDIRAWLDGIEDGVAGSGLAYPQIR